MQITSISRSAGRNAPAAAAYRAGERIRNERTGKLHNYSKRRDVLHSEIFLPAKLADSGQAAWARDRARLWNMAEAAERRRDSRVACEYQIALPAELTDAQRLTLARGFSQELADRHNLAVDLAIHAPRAGGDPRNYHAHLLATTRELTPEGLGPKGGTDMASIERVRCGLPPVWKEIMLIRERLATHVNESLSAAGLEARVDHRSLKAQGLDREPTPHIPFVAYQMERRGMRSEVAERIRERYRSRVAAREARAALPADSAQTPLAAVTGTDELRRRARDAWLQLRRESPQASAAPELAAEPAGTSSEASRDAAEQDLCL